MKHHSQTAKLIPKTTPPGLCSLRLNRDFSRPTMSPSLILEAPKDYEEDDLQEIKDLLSQITPRATSKPSYLQSNNPGHKLSKKALQDPAIPYAKSISPRLSYLSKKTFKIRPVLKTKTRILSKKKT
jgi:hypothetical protein